mmetsp:Transcript_19314/g.47389  ORF Transcript_19314/g.47389 Transcript_19314/m.47389 type:complete len:148 (+) Transcript_19314:205-648(+)
MPLAAKARDSMILAHTETNLVGVAAAKAAMRGVWKSASPMLMSALNAESDPIIEARNASRVYWKTGRRSHSVDEDSEHRSLTPEATRCLEELGMRPSCDWCYQSGSETPSLSPSPAHGMLSELQEPELSLEQMCRDCAVLLPACACP